MISDSRNLSILQELGVINDNNVFSCMVTDLVRLDFV